MVEEHFYYQCYTLHKFAREWRYTIYVNKKAVKGFKGKVIPANYIVTTHTDSDEIKGEYLCDFDLISGWYCMAYETKFNSALKCFEQIRIANDLKSFKDFDLWVKEPLVYKHRLRGRKYSW